MPTGVTGQATDPGSAGVLGLPMNIDAPGFPAIGVMGNGGSGFPSPDPAQGIQGRQGIGVYGTSADPNGSGVQGWNTAGGIGVFGTSTGGGNAGEFLGTVAVIGDLNIKGNITSVNTITVQTDVLFAGGDCAEQFDTQGGGQLEPGTVVVLDREGNLCESLRAYDKKVAGVVSGAGEFKPAIVLDRKPADTDRTSIALIGKVCCKVDAQYAGIDVGDLLTTSPTPGHAMKAADPQKAFGAVIGKALRPLPAGQGLIPILVALQ